MYDPSRETENCGVGLVASLKSVASRKVVEDADEMLIRMSHRGGVGCCPASGDGAGELYLTHHYVCMSHHVLEQSEYSTNHSLTPLSINQVCYLVCPTPS